MCPVLSWGRSTVLFEICLLVRSMPRFHVRCGPPWISPKGPMKRKCSILSCPHLRRPLRSFPSSPPPHSRALFRHAARDVTLSGVQSRHPARLAPHARHHLLRQPTLDLNIPWPPLSPSPPRARPPHAPLRRSCLLQPARPNTSRPTSPRSPSPSTPRAFYEPVTAPSPTCPPPSRTSTLSTAGAAPPPLAPENRLRARPAAPRPPPSSLPNSPPARDNEPLRPKPWPIFGLRFCPTAPPRMPNPRSAKPGPSSSRATAQPPPRR